MNIYLQPNENMLPRCLVALKFISGNKKHRNELLFQSRKGREPEHQKSPSWNVCSSIITWAMFWKCPIISWKHRLIRGNTGRPRILLWQSRASSYILINQVDFLLILIILLWFLSSNKTAVKNPQSNWLNQFLDNISWDFRVN